jgi:hypothetical protein
LIFSSALGWCALHSGGFRIGLHRFSFLDCSVGIIYHILIQHRLVFPCVFFTYVLDLDVIVPYDNQRWQLESVETDSTLNQSTLRFAFQHL